MSILILRLQGPLQSWGEHSMYWDLCDTQILPTRSGIVGLIGCAMGIPRTRPTDLARLSEAIHIGIRADRRGRIMSDYQIASSVRMAPVAGQRSPAISSTSRMVPSRSPSRQSLPFSRESQRACSIPAGTSTSAARGACRLIQSLTASMHTSRCGKPSRASRSSLRPTARNFSLNLRREKRGNLSRDRMSPGKVSITGAQCGAV